MFCFCKFKTHYGNIIILGLLLSKDNNTEYMQD